MVYCNIVPPYCDLEKCFFFECTFKKMPKYTYPIFQRNCVFLSKRNDTHLPFAYTFVFRSLSWFRSVDVIFEWWYNLSFNVENCRINLGTFIKCNYIKLISFLVSSIYFVPVSRFCVEHKCSLASFHPWCVRVRVRDRSQDESKRTYGFVSNEKKSHQYHAKFLVRASEYSMVPKHFMPLWCEKYPIW